VSLLFELPSEIEELLRERSLVRIGIGESGAAVYRCDDAYLKAQRRNPRDVVYGGLRPELERLQWLADRCIVPTVLAFAQSESHDFLVTRALAGDNAANVAPDRIPALIDVIAEACRALHTTPIDACPFDETAATLIKQAEARLAAGLIDTGDFDQHRQGRDPHDLFVELRARRPPREDLVFTHGDLCLPNLILDGDRVTGYVDVGRAGIADRWRDLALCARSICSNWGSTSAHAFIDAYGAGHDWQLLDEFF